MASRRALVKAAARWVGAAAFVTAVLWLLRSQLDKSHMAMAYLLLVLGASARHGRTVGFAVAVLSFLGFNFFLLPPYYTLRLHDSRDWFVLFAFLVTGGVAAQLLYRVQQATVRARRRAEEIERLSVLGAETLNAARAEAAVEAIARVVRDTLAVEVCDIHAWQADTRSLRLIARVGEAASASLGRTEGLLEYVSEKGGIALERLNGAAHLATVTQPELERLLRQHPDARAIVVPLRVRDRIIGALRIGSRLGIRLDDAQARLAAVLSYYAALGVERVRLGAAEERAEALRETDRMKDALLASVSHDLRTPLTTIRGFAHELAATGADERALSIVEETDRLNRLVADLLDLSRLNAGALTVTTDLIAVEDLIGAALQHVGGLQHGREIVTALPTTGTVVVGRFDFTYSLRILVNLLENALKYSPADKPIELRVREHERWVAVDVLDRGPGIAADEVPHVFQPFHRGRCREPDAGGTGLGLAIAQRLAQAQGGSVSHTPRPGGGSRFTLQLPVATAAELNAIPS